MKTLLSLSKFLLALSFVWLNIMFVISCYADPLPEHLKNSPLLYQVNSANIGPFKAIQTPLTYGITVIDPATNQVVQRIGLINNSNLLAGDLLWPYQVAFSANHKYMYVTDLVKNVLQKFDRVSGELIDSISTNVAVGPYDGQPGYGTPYGNDPNGLVVLPNGDILYITRDLSLNPNTLARTNGSITIVDGKTFTNKVRYPLIGVSGHRVTGHNLLVTPDWQYAIVGSFGPPADAALLVYRIKDLYKDDNPTTPSWSAVFHADGFVYPQPFLTQFPQYAGNDYHIRSMAISTNPDGSSDRVFVTLGGLLAPGRPSLAWNPQAYLGFGVVDFNTHQTTKIPFPSNLLVTDPLLQLPALGDGVHGIAVSSDRHKVLINSVPHNGTFIYDTDNLSSTSQPLALVHWPVYEYLRVDTSTVTRINSDGNAISLSPDNRYAYISLFIAEKIMIVDLDTNNCVQDPALIASPPIGNPGACLTISTGARSPAMSTYFSKGDND